MGGNPWNKIRLLKSCKRGTSDQNRYSWPCAGIIISKTNLFLRSLPALVEVSAIPAAWEFRRRFEDEMNTISCRELTGMDLSTVDGREDLMNSDIAMTVCFPAVAHAYRIVSDLLKNNA